MAVPSSDVRSLTLSNVANQLPDAPARPEDALNPGEMQLYAFYAPGLEADVFKIKAEQQVFVAKPPKPTKPTDPKPRPFLIHNYKDNEDVIEPQDFEVIAPQFSLPANSVHSHYPPDGHQDEARVLPHVIFNDPHLPWERNCGTRPRLDDALKGIDAFDPTPGRDPQSAVTKADQDPLRAQVPWLAVVGFDPLEELSLNPGDLLKILPTPTPPTPPPQLPDSLNSTKPPPTGAYAMTVSQYLTLFAPPNRPRFENRDKEFEKIKNPLDPVGGELMNVIFPKKRLVQELFGNNGENIEQHKHLAHVRRINTEGMPDIDPADQEQGLFSVVVSHRTGPNDIKIPRPQVVHLVSIEHLDGAFDHDHLSTADPDTRFAMVSLFSWMYLALPPNPVNFIDTMINLGKSMQPLCPVLPPPYVMAPVKELSLKLAQRLKDGYMFVRWRTQTGEPSVAIHRGPLCPGTVSWPPSRNTLKANSESDWPVCSNYGTDYQILDKDLGLMDLSYSLAWQLGKTLAIADRNFSGALMRFRSITHEKARDLANRQHAQMTLTSADVAARAISASRRLMAAARTNQVQPVKFAARDATIPPPLPKDPAGLQVFQDKVKEIATLLTTGKDSKPYNEFNVPQSADWPTIARWISDKLYLGGIPAHYLFVDPSHVPMESLRVFHIDASWLDCLIDGALSTANHLERDDDFVRRVIKQCYNNYLTTPIVDGKHAPQIPKFGFVIRSSVIKAFPDLRVRIEYNEKVTDGRAPICRLTNIDPTTLLCLLDRQPEDIAYIRLSQPPHQQRFSLGDALDGKTLEFEFSKLYTDQASLDAHIKDNQVKKDAGWNSFDTVTYLKTAMDVDKVYNWNTRVFNIEAVAGKMNNLLNSGFLDDTDGKIPPAIKHYDDQIMTSVPMALQLNDPVYFLNLPGPTDHPSVQEPRQLWNGPGTSTSPSGDGSLQTQTTPATPATQPKPRTSATMTAQNKAVLSAPHLPQPKPKTVPSTSSPSQSKSKALIAASASSPISKSVSETAAPIPNPPRLSRPIPTLPKPHVNITNPAQIRVMSSNANLSSHYAISVFPNFNTTRFPTRKNPTSTIPTQYPYLIDLIFSVRRTTPANTSLTNALTEIVINIPMNPLSTKLDSNHLPIEPLFETYDGPGARMLSNLRYNVLLSRSPGQLQARIVPRGNLTVPIASHKTDEMSFVLSECWISDIGTPFRRSVPGDPKTVVTGLGVVNVRWLEGYVDMGSPGGIGWVEGGDSPWEVYKENRNVDPERGEDVSGMAVKLT